MEKSIDKIWSVVNFFGFFNNGKLVNLEIFFFINLDWVFCKFFWIYNWVIFVEKLILRSDKIDKFIVKVFWSLVKLI